jgi:L-asparaginase / beta-aspartyl-peptidase
MRALPLLFLCAACSKPAPPPAPSGKAAAVAHGGLGSPPALADGPRKAVDAALRVLADGADPLDAAVAGVTVMEDDPRFNAGTGAVVRLDGETVQMDASLMRSDGKFAAVAAIERVRNPIQVARAVMDTPHLMLVGDGATRFARTLGMADYDPATPERRERMRRIQAQLVANDPKIPEEWRRFDWRKHWNFARSLAESGLAGPGAAGGAAPDAGHDTVGVAVRARDGRFAVALSTGGTAITLRGRVGDVPIYGCGLYAGPAGASAATGDGERIIETALGRQVQEWLAAGMTAEAAAQRGADLVRARGGGIGVIVIDRASLAAAASEQMAWAGRSEDQSTWSGPEPK